MTRPVVFFAARSHYESKLDRSRWKAIAPLDPVLSGLGWDNYRPAETLQQNAQRLTGDDLPLIVAFKPMDYPTFSGAINTMCIYNECHRTRFPREIELALPGWAVFHHLNDYRQHAEFCRKHDVIPMHVPHCADPAIFHATGPGAEKAFDLAVVGCQSEKIYPLRSRILEAAESLQGILKTIILDHPGHVIYNAPSEWHLHNMARVLRASRVAAFCSSIYRYRLQKYVEAAACGCAIAADLPSCEDHDSLLKCMIPLHPSDSANTIARVIREAVSSSSWVLKSQAASKYAEAHTPRSYCDRLLRCIGWE